MDNPTPPSLEYEETPIIEPITDLPDNSSINKPVPSSESFKRSSSGFGWFIITTTAYMLLFAAGVGASMLLRQYRIQNVPAPSIPVNPTVTPTKSTTTPPISPPTNSISIDPYLNWKSYQVTSGSTKLPIPGITFKLPSEMLSPICDGASCASQGTYLPHGSRFTVAARGKGQLLIDARGNIVVTDSGGKPFTTKGITLTDGRKALEYSGLFTGSTVGGYTFSQMRGLMIEINDTESLEMNHFTPSGVNADFAKDDLIFDSIIASLSVSRFPQATLTPTTPSTSSAIGR